MIGSPALLKLLHYEAEEGDLEQKRSYHYSSHYDHIGGGLQSCTMEHTSAVPPPNATWVAALGCGFCTMACLLSRRRHQEHWWVGGLGLGVGYYAALKSHKVGNGPQGHSGSLWCAVFGFLGMTMRLACHSGTFAFNLGCLGLSAYSIWFELGRFHWWSEWVTQHQRRIRPNRNAIDESVWAEYVPSHAETEFHRFKPLHVISQ